MQKYLHAARLLRRSTTFTERKFSILTKCSVPKNYSSLISVRNRDDYACRRTPVFTAVRFKGSADIVGDFLQYEQLIDLMECGDIQLIDVRDAKEIIDQGEFPGAINIPLPEVKKALKLPKEEFETKYGCKKPEPKDCNIVFVSQKSIKSSGALEIAHKLGYTKSKQYVNGYEEWQEKQACQKGSAGTQ